MRIKNLFLIALPVLLLASCNDSVSYNELLAEEEKAINSFLAQQEVALEIPADTVFQTGEDAPYYKLDEDGNIYMQVIKAGDRVNNRAQTGQNIYFRFSRIDIKSYAEGEDPTPEGNYNSISYDSFKFNDFTLESTYQYGQGIQYPLYYLGIDCEVNILIKSEYGFYDETSNVNPYLYHITYYKQKV